MNKTTIVIAAAFCMLSSCAAKKELATANNTIDSLNRQVDGLNKQVEGLNKEVANTNQQVSQLKTTNAQYSKEAEDCRIVKENMIQRYNNLNNALAKEGTSLEEIRYKAAKALEGFLNMGAEVSYRDGYVIVSMTDELAFPKNSTKISANGEAVLKVVADVLAEFKNLTAVVVGNTDNQPAKGYKDNWSLSTERANAATRVLINKFKADPARITAAGRSLYHPVADNTSSANKAKNRRIEILFNPDLDRLWELSRTPQ